MNRLRSPLGLLALAFTLAAPGALAQSARTPLTPHRAVEARVAHPEGHDAGGVHIVTVLADGSIGCDVATETQVASMRASEEAGGPIRLTPLPSLNRGVTPFTIIIRATDQLLANPEALLAFRRAAARWERIIQTPVQTVIDLDYGPNRFNSGPFGPNILASANSAGRTLTGVGPTEVKNALLARAQRPADQALITAIPVPTPSTLGVNLSNLNTGLINLQVLGFLPATVDPDTAPFGSVPNIGFNSAFSYDFDPNDGISGGTDFDAVVVHEIGHNLGFTSRIGNSTTGSPTFSTWDMYRVRPEAVTIGESYTDGTGWEVAQRVLTPGPVSGNNLPGVQVMFTGDDKYETSTATGGREGGDGQQASHWRADEFSGAPRTVGIMDPTISGGVRDTIRVADRRALQLFGYTIDTTPSTASAALSIGGRAVNIDFLTPLYRAALPTSGGSLQIVLQNTGTGNALDYSIEVEVDSVQGAGATPTTVTLDSETGSVVAGGQASLTLTIASAPGAFVYGRLVLRTNDEQRAFSDVPFQISLGNPQLSPISGTAVTVAVTSGEFQTSTFEFRNGGDAVLTYVRVLEPAASDPRTAERSFEDNAPVQIVSVDNSFDESEEVSAATSGAGRYDFTGMPDLRLYDLAILPSGSVAVVDGGTAASSTIYVLSADLTTLEGTFVSTTPLGEVTGLAYNTATESLWIASQASGFIREIALENGQFSLTGNQFGTGASPFGLDYSRELGAFFFGNFDTTNIFAMSADGRLLPGYPSNVEERRSSSTDQPGVSITEGLLEMTSSTSRSISAGQFGGSIEGVGPFFLGTAVFGLQRSPLDPSGTMYITTRTGGGAASVRSVDPPDLPAGVGTRIKTFEPFFSTDLIAPGATQSIQVNVDGRDLVEGQASTEVVFLTNSATDRITRIPVTITVRGVAGEEGPGALLDAVSTRPNPIRGAARVSLTLSAPETVTVGVYNTLGQRVAVLADAVPMATGETTLALPTNALAAGVYVVRVQAGASVSTHKVTVIR